ncbi:MAG: hypothetical protein PHW24_05105, partial [Candidatus Moranbacteria bacterium]|nr:hypothetical protein [Candidatus Moranbacteria bacterium]
MKFLFQAKSSSGEVVKGKIDATNTEAATLLLQEKGFVPLKIELESATPNLVKEIQHLWEGVNLRELSVFFR